MQALFFLDMSVMLNASWFWMSLPSTRVAIALDSIFCIERRCCFFRCISRCINTSLQVFFIGIRHAAISQVTLLCTWSHLYKLTVDLQLLGHFVGLCLTNGMFYRVSTYFVHLLLFAKKSLRTLVGDSTIQPSVV